MMTLMILAYAGCYIPSLSQIRTQEEDPPQGVLFKSPFQEIAGFSGKTVFAHTFILDLPAYKTVGNIFLFAI